MTAHPASSNGAQRARSKELQEEVARSLERELKLLAEDRQERARMLGLDIGAPVRKVAGQA
ncbi:hypothetical protein JQ633_25120 [Bradyrhizobium tropiciagri]|uniref:hypothetical protein n=1 Tax=Bradyrhizobium tropiciagri TaxID=312253 RepID=UPI001BA9A54E|nr:hypothetical protein [Bradyrhizobium tropiciagri]MBR0873662.1 hypothetical protein [Bradyrhizobium tropiciagri]